MSKKRKKNGKAKGSFSKNLKSILGFSLKTIPFFLLILFAGGIFVGVRGVLYADPSLTVQSIRLNPPESLIPAQREMLETALIGKNILKVDIQKISKTLESDPWVQSARVTKNFPSTLDFDIVRRKPFATVRFSQAGVAGLIADDGKVVELSTAKDTDGLVIEAFDAGIKDAVKGYHFHSRGFLEAVKFAKAFEKHPLAKSEQITRISIDRIGNVTITLGKGPQFRLGRRAVEVLPSFEKIISLLQGPDRAKIEYVDLQFDNVIVKQKK